MPRNIKYFLFALALIGLGLAGNTLIATTQTLPTPQQEQNEPLPKGKWKVVTLFDSKQYADPSVPAELTRITTSGDGTNSGLVELIIKNRTSKNISSLKVGYYLTTDENQETILFQGPALEIISKKARKEKLAIPANQRRTFDVKDGKLSRLIKPLVNNGQLNGSYTIMLKINAVTFEDGSVWRDGAQSSGSSLSHKLRTLNPRALVLINCAHGKLTPMATQLGY
jgi:hypothetical protein